MTAGHLLDIVHFLIMLDAVNGKQDANIVHRKQSIQPGWVLMGQNEIMA